MPLISFKNLGARGIITDLAPSEIPLDAWTRGLNVRFTPLGVERTRGHRYIGGVPAVEPLQAFYTMIGDTVAWCYWGAKKAYSTNGTTQYDITRTSGGPYLARADTKWTGGNLGGLVIANNGYDVPQVWGPSEFWSTAYNMPHWPSELRAKAMRPFGNVLVAMNLKNYAVHQPTAIRWSHPADPGSVPISWDIADETKDAGEYYFNETMGEVVDLLPIAGDALIYKTDSIYRMQYIGGVFIYKFTKVASSMGMPVARCACSPAPGTQIFWTGDDIVVTDGVTFKSIIDSKMRRRLQNVPDAAVNAAFMVHHVNRSEVWMCLSEEDSIPTKATVAFVYNLNTGAWGIRSLGSGLNFIQPGPFVADSGDAMSWNAITETWDNRVRMWDDALLSRSTNRLIGGNSTNLTLEDSGTRYEGAYFESCVERIGFGIPFKQGEPPDISSWKFCREIWPRMSGTAGTEVEFTLGSMKEVGEDVTWGDSQIFTIGSDVKLNCTLSGRMYALRVRSLGAGDWTLHGFDLEVNKAGSY